MNPDTTTATDRETPTPAIVQGLILALTEGEPSGPVREALYGALDAWACEVLGLPADAPLDTTLQHRGERDGWQEGRGEGDKLPLSGRRRTYRAGACYEAWNPEDGRGVMIYTDTIHEDGTIRGSGGSYSLADFS